MPVHSNLSLVAADLRAMVESLNLESLAEELFDLAAQRIRDRSISGQRAPDGTPWAPNEERYAERKGGLPIGVLTGRMLSLEQIRGTRRTGDDSATMEYGLDDEARRKARWFSEGTSRGQPPREFWAITDEDRDALDALVRQHYDRIARHRGR